MHDKVGTFTASTYVNPCFLNERTLHGDGSKWRLFQIVSTLSLGHLNIQDEMLTSVIQIILNSWVSLVDRECCLAFSKYGRISAVIDEQPVGPSIVV